MGNDQDNKDKNKWTIKDRSDWTLKDYAWAVFFAVVALGMIVSGIYNIAEKVKADREEEYYNNKCLTVYCPNKRVGKSFYCEDHKCVLDTCNYARTTESEYCFDHAISYDKAYVEKHKDYIEFHKSLTKESSVYNNASKSSKSKDSSNSKKNNTSKSNSSSKNSSKSSGKKSGKSSGSYKYDPYDVYKYSDPEDFADEWEDDFDDWEDAYEYWEDSR